MKKSFILCIFVVLARVLVFSQSLPQVTLEGTFFDPSTLLPIPFQSFEVEVLDSSRTLIWLQDVGHADSAGHYRYDVQINNLQDTLYGMMKIVDGCGTYTGFSFDVTTTYVVWGGQDYYICPSAPPCFASWVYGNALGNTPVSFVNRSQQGATSWTWDFGDGGSSSLENPTHTYPANGSYNVCLTVTGPQGCTSTLCDSVRVGGPWLGPNSVDLYYGTIFPTSRLYLIAVTHGNAKPAQFFFPSTIGPNLNQSYSNPYVYEYPGNGAPVPCVDVEFTDSSWAQGCLSLIPTDGCQAQFYTMPDPSGQYSLLVVDNSFGHQITYAWDFGDGSTSTAAHPQHTYAAAGTYHLCVSIADSGAYCTQSFCEDIHVTNKINAPFTIQVVSWSQLTTAALPALTQVQPEISLYPNPAQSILHLQTTLAHQTAVSLKVLDMQGRFVIGQQWENLPPGMHDLEMNVQDLSDGLYLVRILQGGKITTHKMLIQR